MKRASGVSRPMAPAARTVAPAAIERHHVSSYCARPEKDGVGPVLRQMFCSSSIVERISLVIESLKGEEKALCRVGEAGPVGQSLQFEAKAGKNVFDVAIPVGAGQRLVLEVVNPPVDGVWVSFSYRVS